MRYIRLSSKYGNLFLRKSKFEGVQFIQDENGEPRLGIVFVATEGRVTITHEINTSYQWEDRKNIHKLCEIFNEKNDQYLIEKFMQGFEGRIGDDVYFTLVLATKLLTKIIFPHIKKIVGWKEEK